MEGPTTSRVERERNAGPSRPDLQRLREAVSACDGAEIDAAEASLLWLARLDDVEATGVMVLDSEDHVTISASGPIPAAVTDGQTVDVQLSAATLRLYAVERGGLAGSTQDAGSTGSNRIIAGDDDEGQTSMIARELRRIAGRIRGVAELCQSVVALRAMADAVIVADGGGRIIAAHRCPFPITLGGDVDDALRGATGGQFRLAAIEASERVRLQLILPGATGGGRDRVFRGVAFRRWRDRRPRELVIRLWAVTPRSARDGDPSSQTLARGLASLDSALMASISHDIRAPMTVLRGATAMLREEPEMDLDDRVFFLDSLHRETGRVVTMINELLLLGRLNAGKRGRRDPIDLLSLIEGVRQDWASYLETRQITIDLDFGTPRARAIAQADPELAGIWIRNLLAHALKVGGPGATIRVSIRITRDIGGAVAELTVSDDARGVPVMNPVPSAHAATPGPFTTFRRSTSAGKHIPGASMGLILAKKIADAHQWAMAARVTTEGSVVEAWIPVEAAEGQGASGGDPTFPNQRFDVRAQDHRTRPV